MLGRRRSRRRNSQTDNSNTLTPKQEPTYSRHTPSPPPTPRHTRPWHCPACPGAWTREWAWCSRAKWSCGGPGRPPPPPAAAAPDCVAPGGSVEREEGRLDLAGGNLGFARNGLLSSCLECLLYLVSLFVYFSSWGYYVFIPSFIDQHSFTYWGYSRFRQCFFCIWREIVWPVNMIQPKTSNLTYSKQEQYVGYNHYSYTW